MHSGSIGDEPFFTATRFTLGAHAVNGFFAVSGFLVTMSFMQRGARDYALARALRIYPGLVAAVLAVAAAGIALTTFDARAYVASPRLWSFIWTSLTSFKSVNALPGVFEKNALVFPMGIIWTLKYEALCYLGVLLLGISGLLRQRALVLALLAAVFLALARQGITGQEPDTNTSTILRLVLLFASGALMYLWRERTPVSLALAAALALAAFALQWSAFYRPMLFAAEAYACMALALHPALTGKIPPPSADLSYGTYLYGWPVQQALHALFPALGTGASLALAIAVTLCLAAASWFLVEKPALNLKRRLLRARP